MKASHEHCVIKVEFTPEECLEQIFLTFDPRGEGNYQLIVPTFELKFGDKIVKFPIAALKDGMDFIEVVGEDEPPLEYIPVIGW